MITMHSSKIETDHPSPSTSFSSLFLVAGALLFLLVLSRPVAAAQTSDEYIRGYASATLQRDFQITADSLKVQYGVIYIQRLEASDVIDDRVSIHRQSRWL